MTSRLAQLDGLYFKVSVHTLDCGIIPSRSCLSPLFLQKLTDYVCDLLIEESNVQPVSTPVTVCGDIHGQVRLRASEELLHC